MSSANPFKKERYETTILHEAGQFFRQKVSDPRLKNVTITHIELNSDYSEAFVFWDTFDLQHTEESERAISKVAGVFRHHLSKVLKVRIVPIIKFKYNSQFVAEQKIAELLKTANTSEEIHNN